MANRGGGLFVGKRKGVELRVEQGTTNMTITSIKNLLVMKKPSNPKEGNLNNSAPSAPPPRLLEIQLSDGKSTFKAIEWKRVSTLHEDLPVGTVLVINNGKFRGDSWLLEPETLKEVILPNGQAIPTPQGDVSQAIMNDAQDNKHEEESTSPPKKVKVNEASPAVLEPDVIIKRDAEVDVTPTAISESAFIAGGRPAPFPYIKEEWGEKTPKSHLMEWVQRFGKGQLPTWERFSIPGPISVSETEPKPEPHVNPVTPLFDINHAVPESPLKSISADQKIVAPEIPAGSVSSEANVAHDAPVGIIDRATDSVDTEETNKESGKNTRNAVKVIFPSSLGVGPITTDRLFPSMKEAEHTTSMVALAKLSELPQEVLVLHPGYAPPADALPKRLRPKVNKTNHEVDNHSFKQGGRYPYQESRQEHGDRGNSWRNSGFSGKGKKINKGSGGPGGQYSTVAAVPPPKFQRQSAYPQDQYSPVEYSPQTGVHGHPQGPRTHYSAAAKINPPPRYNAPPPPARADPYPSYYAPQQPPMPVASNPYYPPFPQYQYPHNYQS